MTVYWNFRDILDVYPEASDFTCVGTTLEGERCTYNIEKYHERPAAGRILDKMDQCKSLKSSDRYLEDLAALALCSHYHRKPGKFYQIDSMISEWRSMIKQYQKEEEIKATREMKRTVKSLKKQQKVLMDELDEPAKYKPSTSKTVVSNATILKERQANIPMSKSSNTSQLSDPFTSNKTNAGSSSHRIFRDTAVSSWSLPKTNENYVSSQLISTSSKGNSKPEYENKPSRSNLLQIHGLVTPPETPQSSIGETRQAEDTVVPASTPTRSSKGKDREQYSMTVSNTSVAIKDGATASLQIQAVSIGLPKVEAIPTVTSGPSAAPAKLKVAKIGQQIPTTSKSDIPKTQSDSHLSKVSSAKPQPSPQTLSTFNFGCQYNIPSKSFENVASEDPSMTIHLMDQTTMWNNLRTPEKPINEVTKEVHTEIIKSDSNTASVSITTKTTTASAREFSQSSTDKQITPKKTVVESHGYAIITPNSTRYATYLPGAQQYGLSTPPATPKTTYPSEVYTNPLKDAFSDIAVQPVVTRVTRKPLTKQQISETISPVCVKCSHVRNGGCNCEEAEGDEYLKVGCFHSARLRRLRKRLGKKLGGFTTGRSNILSNEKEPV